MMAALFPSNQLGWRGLYIIYVRRQKTK